MHSVSFAGANRLGCRQAVRHQTLTLAFVGSNPAIPANDPLAQLAEQLPFKQWVRSSNLRRVTKKKNHPTGWFSFCHPTEIRTIQMQVSGGHLLPPVQKLVATIIFAFGKNANESPAGHLTRIGGSSERSSERAESPAGHLPKRGGSPT